MQVWPICASVNRADRSYSSFFRAPALRAFHMPRRHDRIPPLFARLHCALVIRRDAPFFAPALRACHMPGCTLLKKGFLNMITGVAGQKGYDPPVSDFKGHRLRMYAGLPRPRRWHHRTRDRETANNRSMPKFKICISARGQSTARSCCASV